MTDSHRNRLGWLCHQLMPELCACCGQWLPAPIRPPLCALCLRALPWNHSACERCGQDQGATSPCRCGNQPFASTICPLRYQGPVINWVLRCKRRGGYPEARLLADCLYQAVIDRYRSADLPDVIVPVPLSWQRRLLRGHNQAALIAAVLARKLGLPILTRALRRIRHTAIQPGQTVAQRHANLRNAFACQPMHGQRVALVDDVMTTGATASTLAEVLLTAGCSAVDIWCATRANTS